MTLSAFENRLKEGIV